ncbi:MAG TPA: hypothetical protein PK170_09260, partial [Anaerolineae bacterium]|nr:hypothetical protein [Anaerolineae bacterium]
SVAQASLGLSRVSQPAGDQPVADGPVVIQPDHMDLSPPLRDIAPAEAPPGEPALMRFWESELLPGHEQEGSFSGVDATLQSGHGPEAMPAPIQNWDGVNNTGYSVRPPDTQGDVGRNHYVQWVNVRFQIWNKSGTSLYGPAAGNTLWSGFGGQCQTTNDGDPVTLYDHVANRWVMMQFAVASTPNLICVAVSQTADPLGSWYRYSFSWPNSYMPDYPKIGLWPDGYYLTVNQFTQAGAWRGAGVLAMERAQMLTGAAAQAVYFNGYSYNANYGGMLPADWEGPTPPPAGAPNPFVEWDDGAWIAPSDALRVWNFHVDWTTPANSYFGTPGSPFVPTYTLPTANVDPTLCAASPACIDQPGTNVNLHDLADRLMHRLQYRNFGTHQTLVTNHTVDTNSPAGRAGIHWYELRNSGGGWGIHQEATYGPADTSSTSRWMGSIAMDRGGNTALGFSITDNVSLYPSIRYVGRLAGDPLNTLPQSETTLVTGGGYQNDSYNRWGDYSAMQVDPTDDCTFWYTQEYAQTSGGYNWYTRIGSFKFPSCTPLAVTLAGFEAQQQGDAVQVSWETVSELDNLGFNLYRGVSPDGWERQLNDALIPSQAPGSSGGYSYTWEDRAGLVSGQTYYLWLEDVDLNGATTLHGPVSVEVVTPTAVTLGGVSASPGLDTLHYSTAAALPALSWLAVVAGAGVALALGRRRTAE